MGSADLSVLLEILLRVFGNRHRHPELVQLRALLEWTWIDFAKRLLLHVCCQPGEVFTVKLHAVIGSQLAHLSLCACLGILIVQLTCRDSLGTGAQLTNHIVDCLLHRHPVTLQQDVIHRDLHVVLEFAIVTIVDLVDFPGLGLMFDHDVLTVSTGERIDGAGEQPTISLLEFYLKGQLDSDDLSLESSPTPGIVASQCSGTRLLDWREFALGDDR